MVENRLKIIFDGRSIRRCKTGVGYYAQNLLINLAKIDKVNTIKAFFLENFETKGLNLINKKTFFSYENHPLGDLWEIFFLPFYLCTERADIFHSPTFHLPLFTFGTKKVVTIFDLVMFKYPETTPRAFKIYGKLLIKAAIRFSDAVIVPSMSTKNDVLEIFGIKEKKIFVVPAAANSNFRIIKDNVILEEIRKKYSLPENYILFVGTIEPRKNLFRLIQSYCKVIEEGNIEHKMVICGGKGWLNEHERVRKLIKETGIGDDVIFTGYVPEADLPAIYNLADLFIYPSLYEGFGIPILEAMACGCPVIASNRASIPEVVGDAGILIDPEDNNSLSEAINKVLKEEELYLRLRGAGLKQANRFSWWKIAGEMLEIYKKVNGETNS